MREFFHTWKFKVILCLLALAVGFMIYAAVSGGNVIFPKSVLETAAQPFVSAANAISGWTAEKLDAFVNAEKYRSENEMLREKLSEMYTEIIDKERTDEENEQLREMLEIASESPDYEWSAPCSVIARSADGLFGGFTINRGSADGIELYDPVFTRIGLVGRITSLSTHYAEVTTLLSTELRIGVITAENHVVGIIENDPFYAAQGFCLMSYINKGSEISEGDVVISSGSEAFPADLVIGTVTEIYPDANGLTLHAVVEPSEDVFSVTSVFVITSFEGQGEEQVQP